MTRVEVLRAITSKCSEFNQKEVGSILDAFEDVICENLTANREDRVPLGRIGNFKVKHVPERSGVINIGEDKGDTWVKPAHDEIVFKVSASMRDI